MNGHKTRGRSKLVDKQVAKHDFGKKLEHIKQKEEHPFHELQITIRANCIDGIKELLPMVVAQFMLGSKQGDYCNAINNANYEFHLTTKAERGAKERTWIIKDGE